MSFHLLPFSSQRFFFCILVIVFGFSGHMRANEPDDDFEETEIEAVGCLQLKSQTELCSADYYIEEKGEKDKEDDRKRKNIGIGEQINVLLTGKPKGNIEDLTWTIKGEGFDQNSGDSFKGKQKITLRARQDLTKDASVTITAKTSEGQQASIIIKIKIPKKITGKEFEGTIDLGNGQSVHTDLFKVKTGEHGLLKFIQVTISPTNVSFKKLKVIERDGDLMWPGKPQVPQPPLAEKHMTCDLAASIADKNDFYDMVGDNREIEFVLDTIRKSKQNPQKFWFSCNFYIHLGNGGVGSEKEDSLFMGQKEQIYHIEALDSSTTKTIVKKFDLTFQRNSNEI